MSEKNNIDGRKKALLEIIENCMRELEYDYFYSVTELTIERNQTIETLRSLCEKHGDQDWECNTHIKDIIEKHLINHLINK